MINEADFETFYLDITQENSEERIADALVRNGFITFDAIHSEEELLRFCTTLGMIAKHRDADKTGLTHITKQDEQFIKDGYFAFTSFCLPLHTDGCSIPEPATLVVLWCSQPAEEGGMSLFVDGKCLYQVLSQQYPQMLHILTTPASAIFADADTFLKGSVFSTLANGSMCIRFRYDALGFYAAPVSAVLPQFLELLNRFRISFSLQRHQGYIIQNGRWLHGRTAFQGTREMYRVLVHTDPDTLIGKRVCLGFSR